jgi:hypothetical protein
MSNKTVDKCNAFMKDANRDHEPYGPAFAELFAFVDVIERDAERRGYRKALDEFVDLTGHEPITDEQIDADMGRACRDANEKIIPIKPSSCEVQQSPLAR